MLFFPAALPLSAQTLTYVAAVFGRHRKKIGSCWRKLNPGRQALLVLAYLRKDETFAGLAAGSASAPPPHGGTSARRSPCWPPSPRSCAKHCGTRIEQATRTSCATAR